MGSRGWDSTTKPERSRHSSTWCRPTRLPRRTRHSGPSTSTRGPALLRALLASDSSVSRVCDEVPVVTAIRSAGTSRGRLPILGPTALHIVDIGPMEAVVVDTQADAAKATGRQPRQIGRAHV